VQLATLQELARYWASDYDLGRVAARLNALPQFMTEIDGSRSLPPHPLPPPQALPLVMTHGWPGPVIELLETIGPLTDPTAHGGHASDARLRLSSGGGSMPAQTTNLFLLEDLEDVGRTSELAESDLDALHAVASWIKTYVVQPHKDLGRAGPVCPFVPEALERKTLWLAPEQIVDRDMPDGIVFGPFYEGHDVRAVLRRP
jgi:hypothetical protein